MTHLAAWHAVNVEYVAPSVDKIEDQKATNMNRNDDIARNAASALLTVMGNSHRLLVLKLLLEREASVGELARAVGLSQSSLSQHLAKMRNKELVRTRRDAQTVYYSCSSVAVRALLATIDKLIADGEILLSEKSRLDAA